LMDKSLLQTEPWLRIAIVVAAPFIGSFFGVLVERFPQGKPLFWSRSECPACGHKLAPLDLIPIASWLVLRGRCRYCGVQIGCLPLAMELFALVIAIWAALSVPPQALLATAVLGWLLLPLAVIDWRHYRLPDALTLPLAAAGIVAIVLMAQDRLADHLIGMTAGYLVMSGIGFAYRRMRRRPGLGQGDARLFGALGAWVGWEGLAGIALLASVFALCVTAIQYVRGLEIEASTRIPFGTYLAAGGWLIWLYGPLSIG
jgi:leader peptidase (prepilin peptidase)/N-methyltransferase